MTFFTAARGPPFIADDYLVPLVMVGRIVCDVESNTFLLLIDTRVHVTGEDMGEGFVVVPDFAFSARQGLQFLWEVDKKAIVRKKLLSSFRDCLAGTSDDLIS